MTLSQYWSSSDEQAWIKPVLLEVHNDGAPYSEWAELRAEVAGRLADLGAGAMVEDLLRPLDEAVSAGADFTALTTELVTEYQAAAAAGDQGGAAAAATAAVRFVSIEPVEGYLGWWQGFDNVDQGWKYVASVEMPTDETTGWTPSDQMDWSAIGAAAGTAAATADSSQQPSQETAPVAESARFASIGPVEGYPGWWQGFDNEDQGWKYVASAGTPGDETTGWTPSDQMDWSAVGAAAAATGEPEAAERPIDPEVVAAVDDAIKEAIAEGIAELGVGDGEGELSAEELAAIQEDVRKIMLGESAE